MLHEVTADGGLGFCHAAVPELLPVGYHGPLVLAFDSNVLIDLQEHGGNLLNGEDLTVGEGYEEQLLALGTILDIWMLRYLKHLGYNVKIPDYRTISGISGKEYLYYENILREIALQHKITPVLFQASLWAKNSVFRKTPFYPGQLSIEDFGGGPAG